MERRSEARRTAAFALTLAMVLGAGPEAARGDAAAPTVVARASDLVLPCVAPALRAAGADGVRVLSGEVRGQGNADVLVGGSAEIDRALESGLAFPDSDAAVGVVGWVLVPGDGRSLADLAAVAADVAFPAGRETDDVRLAIAKAGARGLERPLPQVLGSPRGVVPSWAPSAPSGTPLDVRPLRVRAAVSRAAANVEGARAVVQGLSSEAGRRAFARCTGVP